MAVAVAGTKAVAETRRFSYLFFLAPKPKSLTLSADPYCVEIRTRSRKSRNSESGGVLIESAVLIALLALVLVTATPGIREGIFANSCYIQIGMEQQDRFRDHWDGYGCTSMITYGPMPVYDFTFNGIGNS